MRLTDMIALDHDKEKCNRLAAGLYSVYCNAIGGVAFNGDPLPNWKEFSADPKKVKQYEAWLAVADEAISELRG